MSRNWNWNSRLDRAFSQRIYVVGSEVLGDEEFYFRMMGNSDRIYDITVCSNDELSCSCPDQQIRGNFCKHLLNLLIRVIRIPVNKVYQDYGELNNFVATDDTIERIKRYFEGRPLLETESVSSDDEDVVEVCDGIQQRPIEPDDDCPICCERFAETIEEPTVWCRVECGKSVHQSCFLKWAAVSSGDCVR